MDEDETKPDFLQQLGSGFDGAMDGIKGWIDKGDWKKPATWLSTILGVGAIGMLAKGLFKNNILGTLFGLGAALVAMPFLAGWLGKMIGEGPNASAAADENVDTAQQRDLTTLVEKGVQHGVDGKEDTFSFSAVDRVQAQEVTLQTLEKGDAILIQNMKAQDIKSINASDLLGHHNIVLDDPDVQTVTPSRLGGNPAGSTMDVLVTIG